MDLFLSLLGRDLALLPFRVTAIRTSVWNNGRDGTGHTQNEEYISALEFICHD